MSKNTSVEWKGMLLNIVDTPGHQVCLFALRGVLVRPLLLRASICELITAEKAWEEWVGFVGVGVGVGWGGSCLRPQA